MPPDAALLILSVATAFALISAEFTCRNTVHCACGSTGKRFIVCAQQNTTSVDPCTRWPGCTSCKGGSEDPSCFTATNRILRSRQKRQYGREGRRSTNPARSVRKAKEKQTCGDPGFLVNGFRRDSSGTESKDRRSFHEGESLVFGCTSNEYVLQGPSNIICRDGEWSESAPMCIKRSAANLVAEKRICSDPGFVVHGFRTESNGAESRSRRNFQEGESLVFGCRTKGYSLQGSSNMACRNGEWSQPLPTCIEREEESNQTCGDPGFLIDGFRRDSNGAELKSRRSFLEGESLVLSCRSNKYVLLGSSNIICRHGEWSEALPKCINRTESGELAYCKDPSRVRNGNRNPVAAPSQRGFSQGSSIQFSCNQGFTLQGVVRIVCLASGRWSSTVPKCEVKEFGGDGESCLSPESIENGKITYYPNRNSQRGLEVSLDDEYPPNSRLVFSCNEGYRLQGVSEMTCEGESGVWSADPPTCELGEGESCLNPESIENGNITYYPNSNSQRSLEISLDDDYPPNSRLVFFCNEGYRRQGPSEITCQGNTGLWSTEPPTCELDWSIMFCENPGPFINGRVEYFPPATYPKAISENDFEYPEGTRLQYTCAEGFDLQGNSNVSCLPTSHWSAAQPICSTECGRSFGSADSKVYNGTITSAGQWPWVVSIREDSESDIISCGGAVLNTRTVVTAAHCLPDTSKSYILYFGKIRKIDEEDDAKVMKRMSTQIKINPCYSAQTMDSDIALIHFSNPIQFTDRVHPICLPDTSSTFKNVRPGAKGSVAGFGENEFSLTPNNLMRADLPVQKNKVCEDYFREMGVAMNMTHNMFCAGHPNADQATCKGDSGSAFVFRNKTTNHYTLEGLVSASTNGQCGQYGKYIVFTKVFPYVPWLLQNLAV